MEIKNTTIELTVTSEINDAMFQFSSKKHTQASLIIVVAKEYIDPQSSYEPFIPFTSDVRISHFHSYSGPKGLMKEVLCESLKWLLSMYYIRLDDTITIEADRAPDDALIEKVYKPMGFRLVSRRIGENTGGLMRAQIYTLIEWCQGNYNNIISDTFIGQHEKSNYLIDLIKFHGENCVNFGKIGKFNSYGNIKNAWNFIAESGFDTSKISKKNFKNRKLICEIISAILFCNDLLTLDAPEKDLSLLYNGYLTISGKQKIEISSKEEMCRSFKQKFIEKI